MFFFLSLKTFWLFYFCQPTVVLFWDMSVEDPPFMYASKDYHKHAGKHIDLQKNGVYATVIQYVCFFVVTAACISFLLNIFKWI